MNSSDHAITDIDRRRLGSLITSAGRELGTSKSIGELEALLEDAAPVYEEGNANALIRMNSIVRVVDVDSRADHVVTLIYPDEASDSPNAASVTEPLGVALIGCRVGDVVQWADDSVTRTMYVAEILRQPEGGGLHPR